MIDTIAAVATPPGRGGVGIVRVSGPLAPKIAFTVLGKNPKPRYAEFCDFLDIDQGIALYFKAPHSFTGEDVLELHGHGGQVVMERLLQHVFELGARPAKPGEFTERAFLNHKIDLTQAEGIADLINASTSQAAQNAVRSLQGNFSKHVNSLIERLIQLRVQVEAAIDFPDESIQVDVADSIKTLLDEIKKVFIQAKQGVITRDGITAVFTGKPNAGKSSLLNLLSGQDVAIVTDIPGTTRDVLRSFIQIDGLPIHLLDTAGIHDKPDAIEKEGIRRAHQEIEKADHVLLVVDVAEDSCCNPKDLFPECKHLTIIYNKIDLIGESAKIVGRDNVKCVYLSAKTGEGIDLLKQHIKSAAGFNVSENNFSARPRHLDALANAQKFLSEAFNGGNSFELIAELLSAAQKALGEITGKFTSEDLLDRIFSEFCLGK